MPASSGEIESLIRQGRRMEAIRRLRQRARMGLVEAKQLSEALSRQD
jgi:ribosomal protein L7/L12